MRTRWIVAIAVLLLLGAGAGWYYASPFWTLDAMRRAADSRNAAALAAHVDFPALRTDLKQQLKAQFLDGSTARDPGTRAVEALVASGLSDGMVEAAVSPEGLAALFAAAPAARAATGPSPLGARADEMNVVREGLSRFRLVARDGTGGELVFSRQGLGWKLSGVRLPRDFAF